MASRLGIAFQLSASATGMAQGINAGVVELQKLGYAAKQTARDVSTLKTIEISRAFISGISSIANTFSAFTSGAANSIDATVKLSRSLGVSFQELRNLQVAADLSGASSEALAKAFTRAQVTIARAGAGSKEARAALAGLGLSVQDLATQTSVQQFSSIASAITAIQNPAQRAAAAVAIFGGAGAELLPTFRELPDNLQRAQEFFGGFSRTLNDTDASKVKEINDAFGLASESLRELAGRLLVELNPALTRGAQEFVKFVQSINVPDAARNVESLLSDLAVTLSAVAKAAVPLASNLLPSIGAGLAFINRQAIGSAITTLAGAFVASAKAAFGYSAAVGTAAAATVGLGAAIRSTLISTGIGALVVGLGLAAGALAEWALAADSSSVDVSVAVEDANKAMRQFAVDTDAAGVAAFNLGENVKKALAVPASISIREFAEGSLNEARGAIVALAKDLGGLDQVPTKILDQFNQIKTFAEGLSPDAIDWYQNLQKVDVQARGLAETLRKLAEGRKRDADAAKAAADASSKLAEETRKRVAELSTQGLSGAEQARLKADNDRLAILDEERNARAALAQAERQFDIAGILAAEERLRLAQAARQTVQQQARDQRLQELGVDQKILKPAASVADQFKAVRQAFNEKLIDGGEAREALRNLAAEGIEIRRNIDAELRRPANRALEVSDIRSQQGIAQFLGLATGREDPAIAQQREQLAKLEEIRRALIAIGANPVDILGA